VRNGGTLGVAVVGLGVGEQHALAFQSLAVCELRWIYDLNAAHADVVRGRLGGVRIADSFRTILDDPSVDVVSIATFDDAHFAQVCDALDAGKHVFAEKPLCRSLDELREIKRKRQQSGRRVESNLVLRAAPLYRWINHLVREGTLGTLYAIDGEYLYGRLQKITEGWRKNVLDYSVIQGGGVHLVDLMLSVAAERPESVWAAGNRLCSAGTDFKYNDFVAATFRFPSGLVGRITANFGCVHRHHHTLRVFGTKGTFLYDDMGARLHLSRDASIMATPITLSPLPLTKGDLVPTFVDRLLEGADHAGAMEHECNVMSACITADMAAASGVEREIHYV
jgi:predicted dehydrogenase